MRKPETASSVTPKQDARRDHTSDQVTRNQWGGAVFVGLALAVVIWRDLLTGGGLVGGDTYPYFFPQKQVLADAFAHGEIPLWHDRTGLGYPLLAESQAGVFYPSNQVLYRLFDINRAYNFSIVLHYWAAFVATWRFARSQGVSSAAALLSAVVFVYGWFPARLSLEWSIIGGFWFPLCLWLTDRWLRQPSFRRLLLLAAAMALHLLAGHFTLAFITQLTCLLFVMIRTWQMATQDEKNASRVTAVLRSVAGIVCAIALAGILAAVQILPTLELRSLSQRDGEESEFNPQYGHVPPVYVTQLVASWWYWHSADVVSQQLFKQPSLLKAAADTNAVEAHLYFGLAPLALIGLGLLTGLRQKSRRQMAWCWGLLGILALIYAFGWLVPLTRHLPGFGFF
ncbi:MAG: YfhO family protein, partial [Planctomycetaceae bacterium]|nr:YfhO family protein [Planctomycetaceae bacterium]